MLVRDSFNPFTVLPVIEIPKKNPVVSKDNNPIITPNMTINR